MNRFIISMVIAATSVMPLQGAENGDEISPKLAVAVERLLEWLPMDTEAIIVSQKPFQIRTDDRADYAIRSQSIATFAFVARRRGGLWDELGDATIVVAVSGGRGFPSAEQGSTRVFVGCDILEFDANSADAMQAALKACLKVADRQFDLVGHNVGAFDLPINQPLKRKHDRWTFYLVSPTPTVLLCATDREYLRRILTRMNGVNRQRAFPNRLPEWRQVDLTASVWAVRHYRKENAVNDPTSPLGPQSKMNVHDARAAGLVFWYDDKSDAVGVTVRYLSDAPDAMQIVTQYWNRDQNRLMPTISEGSPGVVEISLPIGDGNDWKALLKHISSCCGRAIEDD